MRIKINKRKAGYTIIETMISVSLFLIIITIGMGALLSANLLHQKSRDMRSIMDNLSFIMEDMSRNLRTGYNYRCVSDIGVDLSDINIIEPQSGQDCVGIAFQSNTDGTPATWVYFIDDNEGRILKSTQSPYINPLADINYVQLNPDEVVLDLVSGFSVLGAEPPNGDEQQPLVNIRLVGTITLKDNTVTPFSLQTSVSQRLVDI